MHVSTKPRRVLVTGAGGLVGGRLAAVLSEGIAVVAARHDSAPPAGLATVPLDLLSPGSVEEALRAAQPDAIVHAAAMAEPDACERDPARAERLNVDGTAAVARACRREGLRLIVLSTDIVFPGDRGSLREDDLPAPLQLYGRTKLAAELAAQAELPEATVARIALVSGRGHGRRGTSTEAIAWSLREGRRLRLYTDQYRTPVDPDSLADAVARLLERPLPGLLHLGGPERVSRCELGRRVASVLGLPQDLIEPTTTADHPPGAPRPADVSLDSTRARRELGWEPLPLDEIIRRGRSSRSGEG
jgi:dTDP-4-dehydrorhamnose reductase